jgi:hypothetical protein
LFTPVCARPTRRILFPVRERDDPERELRNYESQMLGGELVMIAFA